MFFKQLSLILSSGLSLLQGLELMQVQGEKKMLPVYMELRAALERGRSLSEAMGEQRRFFSELAIALTVVGEESGSLSEVLDELGDYYKKQEELGEMLVKSALYPLFLLLFSVTVLCFFLVFVLPVLGNAYLSLQIQPNGILKNLLDVREFLAEEGVPAVCLLLIAGCVLYKQRSAVEQRFLVLPVIGRVHRLFLEIRFCKLMALMLHSGVDIVKAVGLCRAAVGSGRYTCWLELFNQRLQRGMDISSAVRGCS
ncbi:General secretion pathway protein F, partial [gut metagenome]